MEPTGWKLVHGDVFRPPPHFGVLTSFVGTGIQLFGVFSVTLLFALLGMLSPASRGALMTVAIVVWLFMGASGGYYSSRLYKTLGGTQWKENGLKTAMLFPGIVFGTGFILNFFIWHQHSSGAVPFTTMIALLLMWFGGSVPLVLLGAYFGFRKEAYSFPTHVNTIVRPIPEQAWFLSPVFSVLLAGVLPFGAVFIELFFILNAIWENQFYYLFGFLFLVFIVLIISCTEIAIVMYVHMPTCPHATPSLCVLCAVCCACVPFCSPSFLYIINLYIILRKQGIGGWLVWACTCLFVLFYPFTFRGGGVGFC